MRFEAHHTAAAILAWLATAVMGAVMADPAAARPMRVISLNLCTDQLLVLLADPEQIAGLSPLARDPGISFVADRARSFPTIAGEAEALIAARPDLVVGGVFGARSALQIAEAKGIPVTRIGIARDFDDIARDTRTIADVIGQAGRAEKLLADMAAILADDDRPDPPRTVLSLGAGAFVAGSGTLWDAVLDRAGLANHAAALGIDGYGFLTVEDVVAHPPDILVMSGVPADRPSQSQAILTHPALDGLPSRRIEIDGPRMACGGPFTATVVDDLRAVAR